MRQLTDPGAKRLYEEELLVGEAMENVVALLHSLSITQRELAARLGVTESRVSQIVSGAENLTLHSLAGIGWAMGVRFELDLVAMSRAERRGTPSERDPAPPLWLNRLRGMSFANWYPPNVRIAHECPPRTRRDYVMTVPSVDRAVAA